jgi:hypothetical protein
MEMEKRKGGNTPILKGRLTQYPIKCTERTTKFLLLEAERTKQEGRICAQRCGKREHSRAKGRREARGGNRRENLPESRPILRRKAWHEAKMQKRETIEQRQ